MLSSPCRYVYCVMIEATGTKLRHSSRDFHLQGEPQPDAHSFQLVGDGGVKRGLTLWRQCRAGYLRWSRGEPLVGMLSLFQQEQAPQGNLLVLVVHSRPVGLLLLQRAKDGLCQYSLNVGANLAANRHTSTVHAPAHRGKYCMNVSHMCGTVIDR